MKNISAALFNELRSKTARIAHGWKVVLVDSPVTPIFRMYAGVLGREPSGYEAAQWYEGFNANGQSLAYLCAGFADLTEFKTRFASTGSTETANSDTVALFYDLILGRTPMPAEIAAWMSPAVTVAQCLQGIITSTEFLSITGSVLGFTSADFSFVYDGLKYSPANGLSGSASASKQNLSVDNMTATSLIANSITEKDLKGGRYDNASVQVFWICPYHPEWGIVPLKGGRFGEVQIKNASFEVELRALMQFLQQPFGDFFTLECSAHLGDAKCKVALAANTWQPNTMYLSKAGADAGIGSYVQPVMPNGYWYQCVEALGAQSSVIPSTATAGDYGNSALYLTPTAPGAAPVSAPYGVESFSITTGRAQIHYAMGKSGGTEPAWTTTVNAETFDNQVHWKCIYARSWTSEITAIFNRAQFEDTAIEWFPVGYFQYGVVTFISGENAGLSMEVRAFDHNPRPCFYLMEAMPNRMQPGDQYVVTAGCAKTRAFCQSFDNLNNIRAFPDMPTEDKALATPNFTQQGTQAPPDQGGS